MIGEEQNNQISKKRDNVKLKRIFYGKDVIDWLCENKLADDMSEAIRYWFAVFLFFCFYF